MFYDTVSLPRKIVLLGIKFISKLPLLGNRLDDELASFKTDVKKVVPFHLKKVEDLDAVDKKSEFAVTSVTKFTTELQQAPMPAAQVLEKLNLLKKYYDKDLSTSTCGNLQIWWVNLCVMRLG